MINPEIENLKNHLSEDNLSGLALDIDETLAWTIGLWVKEMQELFGNPECLTVRDMARKYRYVQNVPYWQTPEALAWVVDHINDDGMQERIDTIKDSVFYVNKINKVIPIVAYITTRPLAVISGTKTWLTKNNFPLASVITRPIDVPKAEGNKWKAEVLEYLYPQVFGIVEDNEGIVAEFSLGYKGHIFLLDHNTTLESHLNVVTCPEWSDVNNAVQAALGEVVKVD